MKRIALLVCLLALLAHAVVAAEEQAPEKVVIEGKEYTVIPDEVMRELGFSVPDLSREENAATDYLRAGAVWVPMYEHPEFSKAFGPTHIDGWTDESAPLRVYLRRNKKTLALIESACTKSTCHFPFLHEEGERLGEGAFVFKLTTTPYIRQINEYRRLLTVAGRLHEFEGRPADALGCYMLIYRLSDHVAQDPVVLNGLIGIVGDHAAERLISQCLVRNKLDDETLEAAQRRLERLSKHRPNIARAVQGARVLSLAKVEHLTQNPSSLWEHTNRDPSPVEIRWAARIRTVEGTEQLRQEVSDFWDTADKMWTTPLHEHLQHKEEIREKARSALSWLGRRASSVNGALWGLRASYGVDELSWKVLDVEFALARYRIKHGTYPQRLDELKALMLSDGIDPFSAKPLKYRMEEDGSFTIWSVGHDLVDDGGKVGQKYCPWSGDDYVWNSGLLSVDPEPLD